MIKKWILKAIVQKTISYLPYRNKINYFFQKHITKGVILSTDYFEDRLHHASNHIQYYQHKVKPLQGAKTFELGCGWYPVVPLSMYLNGAAEMYSTDISRLMNKESLKTTLAFFIRYEKAGKLAAYFSPITDRMNSLKSLYENYDQLSFEQILERLHFRYLVGDLIQSNDLPLNSIDLTHSNNTFEHVYPEVLKRILLKFVDLGKEKQVCHSHFVDMSDHFAHFDRSITIYNFLQFSAKRWSKIDNDIQPQNRLRMPDYQKMYAELNIPISDVTLREGNQQDLATIALSKEFQAYTKEELAISHCHIYSLEM